jgi:uncharacterized iron-regulated membrane protein
MIRNWHRWLAVVFGIFILWIATTGVLTQGARIIAASQPRPAETAPKAPEAPRPPQTPLRAFIHTVTDLHSGEALGKTGQAISLLSGLALIFFAGSGLYMYVELYRGRMVRIRAGKRVQGGRWFWK